MRRCHGADGIASGAIFAQVASIEDASLNLGVDVEIVSKQSSRLLHLFRPRPVGAVEAFER